MVYHKEDQSDSIFKVGMLKLFMRIEKQIKRCADILVNMRCTTSVRTLVYIKPLRPQEIVSNSFIVTNTNK